MMQLWLAWRYFNSGGRFFNLTTALAMVGMIFGVASLVVSMAVVSGYERTLRKVVIDVVGHLTVVKRGRSIKGKQEVEEDIKPLVAGYKTYTPFVVLEAVLAHNKKITGILIEGADENSIHDVLNLKSRLIKGSFDIGYQDDLPKALIGKGIAEKFSLQVGDVFRAVLPQTSEYDKEKFRPRPQKFLVTGVLELGRYDYDNRFVLTNLAAAQDFAEIGDQITGVRIRVDRDEQAIAAAQLIKSSEDSPYWARSWMGASRTMFEAVKYEKPVIFLVIFIILIAAGFNVSSTLFVSVMKRFADISVLKTLGATPNFLVRLFTIQGLIIGFVGSLLGLLLGLGLCYGFSWVQLHYEIIPGDVYKIERIDVAIRWQDLLFILSASMLICFFATLAPALRGARLETIKGLRYE